MKLDVKWGRLAFQYYQKGEFVRTPQGVGVVAEDEAEINFPNDFYHEVKVQHKFDSSDNPSNEVVGLGRYYLGRITQEEYDKEEE